MKNKILGTYKQILLLKQHMRDEAYSNSKSLGQEQIFPSDTSELRMGDIDILAHDYCKGSISRLSWLLN